MRIDVAAAPGELKAQDLSGSSTVVIDVLRATTSLLTGLEAGARRVLPMGSVEEALRLAASLGRANAVLCGERGGRKIEGFDLGNSPREFGPEAVGGKILLCTTTNGTVAMKRCEGSEELYLGSLRNRRAIVDRLAASRGVGGRPRPRRVAIVCAGKEGQSSLEDLLCAGLIVRGLLEIDADAEITHGADAALAVASELGASTIEFLASTAAGEALVRVGLGADLAFCAETDVSGGVPVMRNGAFVLAQGIEERAEAV